MNSVPTTLTCDTPEGLQATAWRLMLRGVPFEFVPAPPGGLASLCVPYGRGRDLRAAHADGPAGGVDFYVRPDADDRAAGVVTVTPYGCGVNVHVNGQSVAGIDFDPAGGPPRLLVDAPDIDHLFAKVLIEDDDRRVLIVNADAARAAAAHPTAFTPGDPTFVTVPLPAEAPTP